MMGTREVLTALNGKQRELLLRCWPFLLGYVVVLSTLAIVYDLYLPDLGTLSFWIAFLGFAATYLLLVKLLACDGLLPAGQSSGIGTYVVLGTVIGLFVGLALMVLIVPGLYLLMRWLPAYARARTTSGWAGSAMRWSWDATEPVQKALSIALVGPVLCYAAALAPAVLYHYLHATSAEVAIVVMNVFGPISTAWLTILGVASFAFLTSADTADTSGEIAEPA